MKTEKQLTAVEWLEKISNGGLVTHSYFNELIKQAKEMEEQQKVEFAFRAYSEKLSTSKDFIEIVNSMRTFKQQEQ
jgi:hypothetical protein